MIRLACADDLDAVDAIYDAILTLEEARPVSFTNWQRGKYPTLDHARRAMEEHTLWLAGEDGKYYGTFILNGIQLPEYAQIPWQFQAPPDQVAVIHTLMVHPDWSGRGKGRELVAFCEEESRRQGKSVIRLDTPEGNTPANLMYARLGYRLAGAAEFFFQGFIPVSYTHLPAPPPGPCLESASPGGGPRSGRWPRPPQTYGPHSRRPFCPGP